MHFQMYSLAHTHAHKKRKGEDSKETERLRRLCVRMRAYTARKNAGCVTLRGTSELAQSSSNPEQFAATITPPLLEPIGQTADDEPFVPATGVGFGVAPLQDPHAASDIVYVSIIEVRHSNNYLWLFACVRVCVCTF